MLIDTGTTSNVCGDVWLNTFLESMPEDLKKKVSEVKRNMSFRFGDGRAVESNKCVMLPIKLCNRDLILETFVVPGELPFLLSRCCMKQLGVSLDFENDQIRIGGEPQQLKVTNSGHYVADIMLWENKEPEKYTIEKTGSGESVRKELIVVSDSDSESNDGFCPKESGEEINEPSAEQVEVLDENEISIEESGSVETSSEQVKSESVVEENRDTSELDEFQKDSSSEYETESSIDTVIIPKERYGQLDQV